MKKLFLLVFIFLFLVGSVNALEYRFIKDEGEITWWDRFLSGGLFVVTEQQCQDAVGECDGDDLVYQCIFHEETGIQLAWCECHLMYDSQCSGDECESGDTQCNGDLYYTCDDGQWNFEGNVEGKCGYQEPTCITGTTKCEGIVSYNCENSQWERQGQIIGKCGYTGIPVDPILTEVSHNIVGSLDGKVTGEYTLRNTGGDMTRHWILEQQVNLPGAGAMSVVAITQTTCDEDTPENVHKTFNMDAGEELTISLTSQVPESKINILGFTEVHIALVEECGSQNFKQPYLKGKYMNVYQVKEISVVTDTCMEHNKLLFTDKIKVACEADVNCVFDSIDMCRLKPGVVVTPPGEGCLVPWRNPYNQLFPITKACSNSHTESEFEKLTSDNTEDTLCEQDGNCKSRGDDFTDPECVSLSTAGASININIFDDIRIAFGGKEPGVCLVTSTKGIDLNEPKCFVGFCLPIWQWIIGVVLVVFLLSMLRR